jgi:2-keto-3-deoxy-L-rhamnonate aldolase RhmA
MFAASLKTALKAGKPVLGTMLCELHSPGACRLVQNAGYDFVIFDTEHNRPGIETMSWIIRSGRDIDLPVIVRAPAFEGQWPTRYLDLGAAGNLFPRVETAEEAERMLQMVKYPPVGARGLGTGMAHDDYQAKPAAEFTAQANEELLVVVQLETERGWANRDEIFSVPGIDATFIGPNDLALSLGLPGQLGHPTVLSAMEDIFASAAAHGVAPGIHAFSVERALHFLSMGASFLAFSSELSLFVQASRDGLAEIREAVSGL